MAATRREKQLDDKLTTRGDPTEAPTFLLTNNPGKWDFDPEELATWVETTASGKLVEGRWSTGTTKKIEPGYRAFLLRQGVANRGIFASGTFVTDVFSEAHWDGSGGNANYADVDWDIVLDPNEALPIETLFSNLQEGQWEPRASGRQINPDVARNLELLWADHVKGLTKARGPGPASVFGIGQGRLLDAKLRKEIEDLAQRRLMELYQRAGWQVEDRRHGNPYDARATKDGLVLYLEAKGTVTLGDRVIVTRGEVAWAREHPGQCVLGVLSGITLRKDGSIRRRSGILHLFDWNPDDDSLVALTYDHFPDADSELALD